MRIRRSSLLSILSAVSLSFAAFAAPRTEWKAGVATIDITPKEAIWMAGYAARQHPSEGVVMPLHAKALAIEDRQGHRAVIVTSDILGFPRGVAGAIAEQAQQRYRLTREQLALTSSHIHSGPVIGQSLSLMYPVNAEQAATIAAYTAWLEQQVVSVIGAALKDLRPANLSLSRGEAGFAVNRRQLRNGQMIIGVNPSGPVDHEVTVLRVSGPDGKLRAVLFRYACHNTTLEGNFYKIHGDYAGIAQEKVEKAHPGTVALFALGCAGDSNPEPRGKEEIAVTHGQTLARAVEQALGGSQTPLRGPLRGAFARVDLPFATPPTREEFQARLTDRDPNRRKHAQAMLALLDKGQLPSTYAYPVQVLQFGKDLTMVVLGGKVVVDYTIRLKQELGAPDRLWVTAYANDVCGYIPSRRVLTEGGYEAVLSQMYYGHPAPWTPEVEDLVVGKVKGLVKKVR